LDAAAAMDAISFRAKRAHLGFVRFGKVLFREAFEAAWRELDDWQLFHPDEAPPAELLARLDLKLMTPARYELMFELNRQMPSWTYQFREATMVQRDLISQLGLHPSTVSVMIKRLQQLGLLTSYKSGRTCIVSLTARGIAMIRAAMQLLRSGRYDAAIDEVLELPPLPVPGRPDQVVLFVYDQLYRIGRKFRYATHLAYPLPQRMGPEPPPDWVLWWSETTLC
jgi:DNA-binding MarR family transcriptional regulator